ncbi:MAG: ribbon-helix-helix domain-containing protein [Nanoarchaeota archaeon]|mgnify:CR=1 FL=1
MDTISFKLQEDIVKTMDKLIKPLHFNNRTEFIREAIREMIWKVEAEITIKKLEKFKGAAKVHITDAQLEKTKERVGNQLMKEWGLK